MTKEKKIKDLLLKATDDEAKYWDNFLSEMFDPFNNKDTPGTSAFNYKRNKNLKNPKDSGLLLKDEKEIVTNHFKGIIPKEKIKIRFGLFEEKYLIIKIKIILEDESSITFENEICKGRNENYFQMMELKYSRIQHKISINGYASYSFIFNRLIEVYNNYSNYINDYQNVKIENEKTKKITSISKVSAEQLANMYFDDYVLETEGKRLTLTINYLKIFSIKYSFTSDNLAKSFENIKNNFDKTFKFFTSFEEYNNIKIEKINRENETHKPFIAKEEIQELLNNEMELRNKITEYITPKIEMRGKKPFIYHENFLPSYFLEENNICGKPIKAQEEMDKLKQIFKEVCTEEKNKIIESNK